MKPSKELISFLKPYAKDVQQTALWLREFVWRECPQSLELLYDNFNAVVIGFGVTEKASDAYCSIAVYSNHCNFGFLKARVLNDKKKLLSGDGSTYRKIAVTDVKQFPEDDIKKLLQEAHVNAMMNLKDKEVAIKPQIIVKSVSEKKRRP
jgi:hypothetical protein